MSIPTIIYIGTSVPIDYYTFDSFTSKYHRSEFYINNKPLVSENISTIINKYDEQSVKDFMIPRAQNLGSCVQKKSS